MENKYGDDEFGRCRHDAIVNVLVSTTNVKVPNHENGQLRNGLYAKSAQDDVKSVKEYNLNNQITKSFRVKGVKEEQGRYNGSTKGFDYLVSKFYAPNYGIAYRREILLVIQSSAQKLSNIRMGGSSQNDALQSEDKTSSANHVSIYFHALLFPRFCMPIVCL